MGEAFFIFDKMTSKEKKIQDFNPNDVGNNNNGVFGLPFTTDEAELVIIPFPWEVTVSYKPGTASAPLDILEASRQIDLYEPALKDAWKLGIAMDEYPQNWFEKSSELRQKAEECIAVLADGGSSEHPDIQRIQKEILAETIAFNAWVKARALHFISQGKLVVGLGGDHSTPLGLINALSEVHDTFAILQLDAHCDLREAYEGFEFSHASIMYNALKNERVSGLVQVGIRDYCEEEVNYIARSNGRVKAFYDRDMKRNSYNGISIAQQHQQIISYLPEKVYLSFDIDGLDPKLCPNTGTPVAGGMEFEEALHLIEQLVSSGRKIIGFDLNETGCGEGDWDANVAGRLLYRICNLMAQSNGRIK